MRVLHLVKTSSGALWAARQVSQLVGSGVDVHVVLPTLSGQTMDLWRSSGAKLHCCDVNFPSTQPWRIPATLSSMRQLVNRVKPDLIHSHFVTCTLTVRAAFGPDHRLPRIFQVPGPLHLEHPLYRNGEIMLAGKSDRWIASSEWIRSLYLRAGVAPDRIFLSYYGFHPDEFDRPRNGKLRASLGIPPDADMVGNINLIYKPKRYLGQFIGLKAHEDIIQALGIVTKKRTGVFGVLVGGPWENAGRYFDLLRRKAALVGKGRILMPGSFPPDAIPDIWPDFDCAVHVPISENCGGVVEPLAAGIPCIAGKVGGLPEVVIDKVTGITVPVRRPDVLANAILEVLENIAKYRMFAAAGQKLVKNMFAVERTAAEVRSVYEYVLGHTPARPSDFNVGSTIR